MTDVIDDYVADLQKAVGNAGQVIDFFQELNTLSLQIICHTAMGYRLRFTDPNANQYRKETR